MRRWAVMKNVLGALGVLGAPHTSMDINRETVVQLYFQSSLSRERRFHDDQPVKLLHPDCISISPASFLVFAGTSDGKKAEGKSKRIKESLLAKRNIVESPFYLGCTVK